MGLTFQKVEPFPGVSYEQWMDYKWQSKNTLKSLVDFSQYFQLSADEEKFFNSGQKAFQVRVTPYYASLASKQNPLDPIRRILMPTYSELEPLGQQMLDPLGENDNRPQSRIIHRYPDRCLFLVTDFCNVYCRYCTRKHFTASNQAFAKKNEYEEALSYIYRHPEIKEVILSGGDPLTLTNQRLDTILTDLRKIKSVEIIRIGTRIPVVAPMRVDAELTIILKKHKPVFMMTHFNHPREVTLEAAEALELLVDNGVPVFNQMVLLNGVNNHENIIRALSRKLLYLRVKPYYMFQCDPSIGTAHLRTSLENSKKIQRKLWGSMSGLAMPNLSLDIPGGGGKVGIVPNFTTESGPGFETYTGWDNITGTYESPDPNKDLTPIDAHLYT